MSGVLFLCLIDHDIHFDSFIWKDSKPAKFLVHPLYFPWLQYNDEDPHLVQLGNSKYLNYCLGSFRSQIFYEIKSILTELMPYLVLERCTL